jgi:hypothetical protein
MPASRPGSTISASRTAQSEGAAAVRDALKIPFSFQSNIIPLLLHPCH